jgi:hypothetical protein
MVRQVDEMTVTRDATVPAPFEGPPVTIVVTAKDHLVTESGAPSGESSWTFWLRAPSAWAGAPDLDARVLRVARRIYDDMNRVTRERGEAVTYVLREVAARVLTEVEDARQPWTEKGKTLYELKSDGTAEAKKSSSR